MRAKKITEIDFLDDLTSHYARRRFFWGFFLLVLASLLCVYASEVWLDEGAFKSFVNSIFTEVAAGGSLVLFFYALYLYFIDPRPSQGDVEVISPKDIGQRVEALSEDTTRYLFWGRSGSFFRAVQLGKLNDLAMAEKRVVDVVVLLPDFNSAPLQKSYEDIIRSLNENPFPYYLTAQVVATIAEISRAHNGNRYLNVSVYLSDFLPGFRLDVSDQAGIMTQDDPQKKALLFQPDSDFYSMFVATIRGEASVSKRIELDLIKPTIEKNGTTQIDLHILRNLGAADPDDKLVGEINALLRKRKKHRYA